jgi:hypothetical protein
MLGSGAVVEEAQDPEWFRAPAAGNSERPIVAEPA